MWRLVGIARRKLSDLAASEQDRRHALVGPMSLWRVKRRFQIEFLKRVGLRPEHYLLDLGCGTLRGGIPIIEYLDAGHYYGVEARAEVLAEGRTELATSGLQGKEPVLVASPRLSRVDLARRFDVIWAFSVLIHMEDETLYECLRFVGRHLHPTGAFYANVNVGAGSTARSRRGFPVVVRPFELYARAGEECGLRASDLGTLASLGHVTRAPGDSQRMLTFVQTEPARTTPRGIAGPDKES